MTSSTFPHGYECSATIRLLHAQRLLMIIVLHKTVYHEIRTAEYNWNDCIYITKISVVKQSVCYMRNDCLRKQNRTDVFIVRCVWRIVLQ